MPKLVCGLLFGSLLCFAPGLLSSQPAASRDRIYGALVKETRVLGQEFAFRDGYTFTRRAPGK